MDWPGCFQAATTFMVRSGFHCAQPLHTQMGWRPTVRASFAHFNTIDEILQLKEALETIMATR